MAALWMDGFDHYGPAGNEAKLLDGLWAEAFALTIVDTPINTVQSAPGVTSRAVKFSTGNGKLRRSLGGDFTTVGLMTPFYMASLPIRPGGGFGVGGSFCVQQFRNIQNRSHINIQVGTTGRVDIWGGGMDINTSNPSTFLARSTLALAAGAFYHIETKVHLHASSGTVEVRVNGKSFVSYTGNTIRALEGDAAISQVSMGSFDGSAPPSFNDNVFTDDWAAWNDDTTDAQGETALITDFIGQYGVYTLPPVSDATPEQWSTSAGSDSFDMVNETPPDENSTFLAASTVGLKTALTPAALPVNITDIAFVSPVVRSRKTDNGDCDITLGLVSGATESEDAGGGDAQTTNFLYYSHPWENDPDGLGPWDPLSLPDIQIHRSL